ncbi:Spo71p Ecym_3511 [Eremothecium cymbalariae DBVPG|uniref:PH domain-containing protein n=1 Tax=Eremothecium cymbalariae (strain CBS 270.75 / DBVPG 7215 / KCTC 17166 / NRRL Y-17582) TaxID=931890 RepID=G8JS70_ERECY|nr:Hypothetical protein Ecym_3511 [Eremothecium cymbalariae DBVPG\
MELKWDQLKAIVLDEDEFIKYYSDHIATITDVITNKPERHLKKLVIPRRSFTALQLSTASPREISLSSRSVLLGGIPELWYAQHSNSVLKAMAKLMRRKPRNRVRYIYPIGHKSSRHLRSKYARNKKYNIKSSENSRGHLGSIIQESANGCHNSKQLHNKQSPTRHNMPSLPSSNNSNGGVADNQLAHSGDDCVVVNSGFNHAITSELDSVVQQPKPSTANLHTIPTVKFDMPGSPLESTDDIMSLLLRLKNTGTGISTVNGDSTSVYCSAKESLRDPINDEDDEDEDDSIEEGFPDTSVLTIETTHINETERSNILSSSMASGCLKDKNILARKTSRTSKIKFDLSTARPEIKQAEKSPDEDLKVLKPEPEPLPIPKSRFLSSCASWEEPLKGTWSVAHRAKKIVIHEWNQVRAKESDFKNRFFNRFRMGEVIKMEKMLVLVKSAVSVTHPPTTFSDAEPIDTRVYGRWKEHIVVARATGNPDTPIYIQFLDRRGIPKLEKCKHVKSMDFTLTESCSVGFYNYLDRTIYILKPDEKLEKDLKEGNLSDKGHGYKPLKIYILRCSTLRSSGRWLGFLRESIGLKTIPDALDIQIPQMRMSLSVSLPIQALKEMKEKASQEQVELKILQLKTGYRVIPYPLLRYMGLVIRNALIDAGFKDVVRNWEEENVLMGFSWKRYDMLEWVLGDQIDALYGSFFLNTSHILEYRQLTDYPRSVSLNASDNMEEPPHIEGFLAICASRHQGGSKDLFSHRFIKLKYMYTCNGILFYTRAMKGMPPLPTFDLSNEFGQFKKPSSLQEVLKSLPEIYDHNPYPLDANNHICWLNDKLSSKDFLYFDDFALKSAARKVSQIIRAECAIDLTQVESICTLDVKEACTIAKSIKFWNNANNLFWKSQSSIEETSKSIIVITMKNKSSVKLLAPNISMANEWIRRLNELSNYWTARLHRDQEIMWKTKMANLKMLSIQEQNESNILGNTPRWINERGCVSDAIYNVSSISVLRPLIHQGILYQKPRKHSVFIKCYVTLIPGFIVLFECFKRSIMGYSYNTVGYGHYVTVPIEECYIYSGNITSQDLLRRDREFNSMNPGNKSLPRVYLDGWKSLEDEPHRCFTLWFGSKGAIVNYKLAKKTMGFSDDEDCLEDNVDIDAETKTITSEEELAGKLADPYVIVSRLGLNGKSMVFMARSRQERDLWVHKIHCELERIKRL